jgi:hypothetical protein
MRDLENFVPLDVPGPCKGQSAPGLYFLRSLCRPQRPLIGPVYYRQVDDRRATR